MFQAFKKELFCIIEVDNMFFSGNQILMSEWKSSRKSEGFDGIHAKVNVVSYEALNRKNVN